jgi:hypothetical protein
MKQLSHGGNCSIALRIPRVKSSDQLKAMFIAAKRTLLAKRIRPFESAKSSEINIGRMQNKSAFDR